MAIVIRINVIVILAIIVVKVILMFVCLWRGHWGAACDKIDCWRIHPPEPSLQQFENIMVYGIV